jgi:GTPase SAR1 family protein
MFDYSLYFQLKLHCPGVPILLVGNKTDLMNDSKTKQMLEIANLEPVSTSQAQMVADEIQAIAYLECSAKFKRGLQELLECAVRAASKPNEKKRKYFGCCFKGRHF